MTGEDDIARFDSRRYINCNQTCDLLFALYVCDHTKFLWSVALETIVVDLKLFFSDPDPTLALISDRLRIRIPLVYEKYIRNLDYLNIATKPDCLEKFIWTADHLNIAKNLIFFLIWTFLQLCICWLETKLNLDPDPILQIIPDPAESGSGCTTLLESLAAWCNLWLLGSVGVTPASDLRKPLILISCDLWSISC